MLLAETIARHFEGGTVEGDVARIGLSGVEVQCTVDQVRELGAYQAASLFFRLCGGPLGPDPVFASISGYESSAYAAIVTGGCNWACAFGPVLRSGVSGISEPGADEFEIVLDGRRFRGVVEGVDRVMMLDDHPPEGLARRTRDQLGADPWLTPQILGSASLPLLTATGPTVVSVFRSQAPQQHTVEVKVNGADWGPACSTFDAGDDDPVKAIVMLRELAVLTPIELAPPLARDAVQRTLDGLADRDAPDRASGWPGWQAHGGRLGPVLTDVEILVIEALTGPLPADYRTFLTQVAGPGAGPGYGLTYPRKINDTVLLAHAGCGVAWVLRLDPDEYGTVWVDAVGSDGTFARVAASFTDWFRRWLDVSVRDLDPWVQWDVTGCASTGVLSQVLTAQEERRPADGHRSLAGVIGDGAISITAGEGYLPTGSAVDPCHACIQLAAQFDLPPTVFAPGSLLSRPST